MVNARSSLSGVADHPAAVILAWPFGQTKPTLEIAADHRRVRMGRDLAMSPSYAGRPLAIAGRSNTL